MPNVSVPTSKSVSNRLLILQQAYFPTLRIEGLSQSNDTLLLNNLLEEVKRTPEDGNCLLDVGNCGTAFRFLMPYLAMRKGNWFIMGDRRMSERPINPLVDALREWGAYVEKVDCFEHFPHKGKTPLLCIRGTDLQPKDLTLDLSQSSQFLSALMMAAPAFDRPVTFHITPGAQSLSYVRMTASVMQELGMEVEVAETYVTVFPLKTRKCPSIVSVPCDWSGAAFWWVLAALCKPPFSLNVEGIQLDERQPDSCIVQLLSDWGVKTTFYNDFAVIEKSDHLVLPDHLRLDAGECPDLVPLLVVMCTLLYLPAVFENAEILQYKESDRIFALEHNLLAWARLYLKGKNLYLDPISFPDTPSCFPVFKDHRIALAFSLFTVMQPDLGIPAPVFYKSYPRFVRFLKRLRRKNNIVWPDGFPDF